MIRSLLIAVACSVVAVSAYAQTGTFMGIVARDSLDNAISNAEVELPQLSRTTATNDRGEFRFGDVPAGHYAVTVRAVGFQSFADSIDVKPGATVNGEIILTALPVSLDTTRSMARSNRPALPAGLDEMESRRKMHMGGFFVTDSMLRAHDEQKLTSFLSMAPRIEEVLSTSGTGIFIAVPGQAPGYGSDGTFPIGKCYANVYLNGALFWAGPPSRFNPPPDFNAMWAREYSGVEYYASTSSIPTQYNATRWGCGVLLLWTRR